MPRRIAVCCFLLLSATSFANGVEYSVEYTADYLTLVSGGLSPGTEYLDNFDVQLEIDVDPVGGGVRVLNRRIDAVARTG